MTYQLKVNEGMAVLGAANKPGCDFWIMGLGVIPGLKFNESNGFFACRKKPGPRCLIMASLKYLLD